MYVSLEELINDQLPEVKSAKEREALTHTLEAACAAVDGMCKRPVDYFAVAEELPSARVFAGEGTGHLRLPVHVAYSIDQTTGVDAGGHPVTGWVERSGWLYMTSGFGRLGGVWCRGCLYTVRARWGYEQTPFDVREAVKQLAKHFYERQRGVMGEVSPSGFVIERDAPPSVKMLLKPYVKKEFEIA